MEKTLDFTSAVLPMCLVYHTRIPAPLLLGCVTCTQCKDAASCYRCLCVLGTQVSCAKRLNRWRCCLGADSCESKEPYIQWGQERTNPFATMKGDKTTIGFLAKLLWTLVIIIVTSQNHAMCDFGSIWAARPPVYQVCPALLVPARPIVRPCKPHPSHQAVCARGCRPCLPRPTVHHKPRVWRDIDTVRLLDIDYLQCQMIRIEMMLITCQF